MLVSANIQTPANTFQRTGFITDENVQVDHPCPRIMWNIFNKLQSTFLKHQV